MVKHTVILLFVFILSASVTYPGNLYLESQSKSIDTLKVKLAKDLEIGGTESEFFFQYINNAAVDRFGRIYISDWARESILVFDENGNLLRKVGRSGRGPGEFLQIRNISIADNKLLVFDTSLLRVSVFKIFKEDIIYKTDLLLPKLESAAKFDASYSPSWMYTAGNGNYLLTYGISYSPGTGHFKRTQKLVHFKMGSETQQAVLEIKEDQAYIYDRGGHLFISTAQPFARKSMLYASNNNIIYYGWTGSPSIKMYNLNGALINSISLPQKTIDVSNHDLEIKMASWNDSRYREGVREATPETWPVFHWFLVDKNNRVWVAVNTEDRDHYSIHIFDTYGDLFAKTSLPKSVELQVVRSGYAYGVQENKEGIQTVVRYKVQGLN